MKLTRTRQNKTTIIIKRSASTTIRTSEILLFSFFFNFDDCFNMFILFLNDRAIMTHASVPEDERKVLGISDTLVRFIEFNPDDVVPLELLNYEPFSRRILLIVSPNRLTGECFCLCSC